MLFPLEIKPDNFVFVKIQGLQLPGCNALLTTQLLNFAKQLNQPLIATWDWICA